MIDFSLPYSKSKPDFISFLEGFLPEDYKREEEEPDIPFQSKYFEQVTYLGKSGKLDLSVYEVYHNSEHDARVGLTREMFRLMGWYTQRKALVILVPKNGNTYRFSLVTIDLKLDETGKITREYSNPKRYSFILGEGAKLHTPQKFLISQGRVSGFEDLLQRFSVEVVNKEFYNQIAVMFSSLVGGKRKQGSRTQDFEHVLELPSTPYNGHEQKYKEFAVRLIGRTVFCWFLKKKKSANDIPLIPEDVLSTQAISQNPNYYHSRVEPLFFNVLNTPVNERTAEFKEKPYDKIPFLNGGLFEPQPDDFYTSNYPNYALKIPDEWWKDFIEILETYNFTIDENTSIDIDLSVDPEMLGRIFENLLAEINPETGETARKSTGSYYTPRPIVEYMVDESLKQYLVTKTGIEEENLETLLDYSREESGLEPAEEQKVIEALNTIKVLDPACGSGAFPMGILQKMLLILQKVDHEAQNSIQQILDDIHDPVYRKLLESKLKAAQVYEDDDLDDYARKLNIIRRSIYGVDIQPVAVDIAKLRFFLSIIVDEVIQDNLPNRGIEPLPNLEFKFVCANTLIPLPPNRELFENADFIEKLAELREQYFISFGEEKESIKKEFRKVQGQMFNTSIDLLSREPGTHNDRPLTQTQMLATWNPFSNETTKWFDPKWMFGETNGFDVVIGNPPYVDIKQLEPDYVKKIFQIYKTAENRINLYAIFIERSYELLNKKGILTFINPNSMLLNSSYFKLRSVIINSLKKIIKLPDNVFQNASVETIILILSKEHKELIEGAFYRNDEVIDFTKIKFANYSQESWLIDEKIRFNIFITPKKQEVINKIFTKGKPLINYSKFSLGITPYDKYKGHSKELIKKREFHSFKKIDNSYKPLISGANINRFDVKKTINQYIKYGPWLGAPREESFFTKERVIIRQIVSGKPPRIYAARTNQPLYFTQIGFAIILKDNRLNHHYLSGILNSKLINFYHTYKYLDIEKVTFQKVLIENCKNFPIVVPNEITLKLVTKIVEKIEVKSSNGEDYCGQENILDLMVYKLYELTWDEALIVDPELSGIISREDYEKAGVEQLAELKI